MQSLEKMSSVELMSIKEELLRQRDMMAKKLISTTKINKRFEKERDNVFKNIQTEGKQLINKCNELRKSGLLLKYRIGIAKNDAAELASEMANNYSNTLKDAAHAQRDGNEGSSVNENPRVVLPFEQYELDKKRDFSSGFRHQRPEKVSPVKEKKTLNPQGVLRTLMKEADNLYRYAEESGLKYEDLMDKIHNFLVGSLEQDPYLSRPDNLDLMGIDSNKLDTSKFKLGSGVGKVEDSVVGVGGRVGVGRRSNSIGGVGANSIPGVRANSIGVASKGRMASKDSAGNRSGSREVVEGRSKSGSKFRIKR